MKDYLSISSIRRWKECAAKERAKQLDQWPKDKPTKDMLIGSMVDAAITLHDLEGWLERHKEECMQKRGNKTYKWVEDAKGYIDNLKRFIPANFYNECTPQVKLSGEIAGVKFKGIADWIKPGLIVELKTRKDFNKYWDEELRRYRPWYMQYVKQLAAYQTMHKATSGDDCDCLLIALSKQTGCCRAIAYSPDQIAKEYTELRLEIDYVKGYLDGTFEPEYCRNCDYCAENAPFVVEKAMEE